MGVKPRRLMATAAATRASRCSSRKKVTEIEVQSVGRLGPARLSAGVLCVKSIGALSNLSVLRLLQDAKNIS
jgi:hypothetical protein